MSGENDKSIVLQNSSDDHEKFTPKKNSLYRAPKTSNGKKAIELYIKKRDGRCEKMSFNKILWRIQHLSDDLNVTPAKLAQAVISDLHNEIESRQIDEIAARKAHNWCTIHPDYDMLASRIAISNHQKETLEPFSQIIWEEYQAGLISDEMYEVVQEYKDILDDTIDYDRDFYLTYHGFKTFEYSYSMRVEGKPFERPQHMWMRVAVAIHKDDIDSAIETYEWMSSKYFIHATPTLFNAGTKQCQMSSCFLLAMKEEKEHPYDSIEKIYETIADCAKISKTAGGIGVSISNVRGEGSLIRSAGRGSSGIVPMLKVFNQTARYVDQGRRRKGAFGIYLEPWHPDIFEFLDMKKGTGEVELRARDLHYALWIPDLFMKRVENNEMWSLMCPDKCPELIRTWGKDFEKHYLEYEKQGKYVKQVRAWEIWQAALSSQIETGEPYMLYKDACNGKSNQQNLGTIRSSNLCVASTTRIMTDTGYKQIGNLENQDVNIWNGFEWSQVTVKKTNENQKMMKISFSNGSELICTEYHKFYINHKYYGSTHKQAIKNESFTKIVDAKDLKIDDKLAKHEFPIIKNGKDDFIEPYTHGFFCGDGLYINKDDDIHQCRFKTKDESNYCARHYYYDFKMNIPKTKQVCQAIVGDGSPAIRLYDEKKKLVPYLSHYNKYDNADATVLQLSPHIRKKFDVPIDQKLDIKLRWLEGFADADGTIARNGTNESLQLCNIEYKFLNDMRLMLTTMGISSKVTKNKENRRSLLPDGKGGHKYYDCEEVYRLLITSVDLQLLFELGFNTKRLVFKQRDPNRDARRFTTVKKIEHIQGKLYDTFCFSEPKMGTGIFEGILTGQCGEIIEYSSNDEIAVCNLASLALASFVAKGDVDNDGNVKEPYFDHSTLMHVTKIVTRNLNKVIDINYYPIPEARYSNLRNRPTGIGVQGLADVFIALRMPFDSPEAAQLNKEIFETIYYGALSASCEIAQEDGAYESYPGSPMSKGILQFDMWDHKPTDRWNWIKLRNDIKEHGIRNSLLVALMPTASTSQLLGFNEAFEPFTSNLYTRKTLAGTFKVINRQLILDLIERGLWSPDMKDKIIVHKGSIQNIAEIPKDIRALYKTSWDMSQKVILEMAAGRGAFVDQSQSMNLFVAEPTFGKLSSMHLYAWKLGLKTGQYYLRTRAAVDPIKTTLDLTKERQFKNELLQKIKEEEEDLTGEDEDDDMKGALCYMDDGCLTCGS